MSNHYFIVDDAFHQSEQLFIPAALNYRNYMRGSGIETICVITSEENERSFAVHIVHNSLRKSAA